MTITSLRKPSVSKDYSNDPVLKDMLHIPCIFCSEYKTPIEFDLDLHIWELHRKELYYKLKSFPIEEFKGRAPPITTDDRIKFAIELGKHKAKASKEEKEGKKEKEEKTLTVVASSITIGTNKVSQQEQIDRRAKMSKNIEYRCLYCNEFVSHGIYGEDTADYPRHVFTKHKGYLPYPSESDLLKNDGKLLKRTK
jgi:hypothetical protein